MEANCQIIFFCSGIINLLFDGLAYNTSGHFVRSRIARIFPRARNFKSASCYALSRLLIWNYSPDYSLKITPLSPITITNSHDLSLANVLILLGEYWCWSLLGLKGSRPTYPIFIHWKFHQLRKDLKIQELLSQRCSTYNGLQHFGYVKVSEILFKGLYVMYDHSNVHSSKIHALLKCHVKNLSLPIKSRSF